MIFSPCIGSLRSPDLNIIRDILHKITRKLNKNTFYDTPLSALHKQLSEVLKPLTLSDIRLKNSEDFLNKFRTHTDPEYSYYCSLDVKSFYTTCDMRKAADTVMERLYKDPSILPPTITPEAIKSLLILSLDNAYCEFDNKSYKQISGGPMDSPLTVTLAEIRVTDIEQLAPETPNNTIILWTMVLVTLSTGLMLKNSFNTSILWLPI